MHAGSQDFPGTLSQKKDVQRLHGARQCKLEVWSSFQKNSGNVKDQEFKRHCLTLVSIFKASRTLLGLACLRPLALHLGNKQLPPPTPTLVPILSGLPYPLYQL